MIENTEQEHEWGTEAEARIERYTDISTDSGIIPNRVTLFYESLVRNLRDADLSELNVI